MGTNFDFVAMVFETSGAVNVEGLNIIKQLIRFASKREGVQNSVFAGSYLGSNRLFDPIQRSPGYFEQGIFRGGQQQ